MTDPLKRLNDLREADPYCIPEFILASELIACLQGLIEIAGDRPVEVMFGANDTERANVRIPWCAGSKDDSGVIVLDAW